MVGPVLVSAVNDNIPNQNAAMVFNTSSITGGDVDLGTPHTDFGGPGTGNGGAAGSSFANDSSKGNMLIISEDLDQLDPDDSKHAGTMCFNFEILGPVTLHSITMIDIDNSEAPPVLRFYNTIGTLIDTLELSVTGDNGIAVFDLGGISDVEVLEIEFDGSAGVDDLCFTRENPGSIMFKVNNNVFSTENVAPFSLAGDNKTRYNPWNSSPGTYLVTAIPYAGKNARGANGRALSVQLTILDSLQIDCNGDPGGTAVLDSCGVCSGGNTGRTPCEDCDLLEVTGFSLIDASSGAVLGLLNNGDTLYKARLDPFSIRAEVCHDPVGSILFNLNGSPIQTENILPYDLNGGSLTHPNPWNAPIGNHTLVAIPYSNKNAKGLTGIADTVNFTVVAGMAPRNASASSTNISASPFAHNPGVNAAHPDLYDAQLIVYPNPSRDELNIIIADPGIGQIVLHMTDLSGKILVHKKLQSNGKQIQHQVNLANLPGGVYQLSIDVGGQQLRERIIKH
jgi:hypothetical protein